MNVIQNQSFDQERALYGSNNIKLINCRFEGKADGESALKESCNIEVEGCYWNLRYPFWHDINLIISNTELTELCRAALWYSSDIRISGSKLHGIKALRECSDVFIEDCDIVSPEFGWSVNKIVICNTKVQSEYFMMRSSGLDFNKVELQGKYSFQYIEDSTFDSCIFNTKDAFWHAKNVVVKNSVVKGEYLAWYCENVTFENCRIIGTQPLCYCKNLKLINCEMIDCDLSFEKSEVDAVITTPVISVKNPKSGKIVLPCVEEIIMDDCNAHGEIVISK